MQPQWLIGLTAAILVAATIACSGGLTEAEVLSLIEESPGPAGVEGPAGLQGEQGERGEKGEKGERGNDGADGVNGLSAPTSTPSLPSIPDLIADRYEDGIVQIIVGNEGGGVRVYLPHQGRRDRTGVNGLPRR